MVLENQPGSNAIADKASTNFGCLLGITGCKRNAVHTRKQARFWKNVHSLVHGFFEEGFCHKKEV